MAIKGGDFSNRGTGSSGGARTRADIVAPPTQVDTSADSGGMASLFSSPQFEEAMANLGPPKDLQDAIDLAEYAYGQNLPAEFQSLKDRLTASQSDPTQLEGLGADITQFGLGAQQSLTQAQGEAAMMPAQLNVLQEALKKKSGVGNQPIGTSETFEKLGVTGIGALSQGLNSRVTEMNAKYQSFSNVIKSVADAQVGISNAAVAQAQGALNEYSILMDEYRYEQDRLDKIEQYERELADQLDLYTKKAEIDHQYELKIADAKASQGSGNLLIDALMGGSASFLDGSAGGFNTDSVPGVGMQTSSTIGEGVVSGYGSKLWDWGLDYVLAGGKGADVTMPFDFEVITTGANGGFGNQVKIKRVEDGQEMWISHLDSIDIDPNATYIAGTKIGTQGNSGDTYSESGGDGTHLDITMPKLDGTGYHTPQEVAAYLGIGQDSAMANEGLVSLWGAIQNSEVNLGGSQEERLLASNALFGLYAKGMSVAEITDQFLTDKSPEATKKKYESALGVGVNLLNDGQVSVDQVITGLVDSGYGYKNILNDLRESENIDRELLWEYELKKDIVDYFGGSNTKGGLKYYLGDLVTDTARNTFSPSTAEPQDIEAVLSHYFNGTMKKSFRLPVTHKETQAFLQGFDEEYGIEGIGGGFNQKYPEYSKRTEEILDEIFWTKNMEGVFF